MANYKYPAEYRAHAVELWRTSGKSQRAVSLELGISNELLRRWVRQDDLDKGLRSAGPTTTEREELRLLRAEVKTLRMERDFLKRRSLLRQGDRPDALRAFSLIEAEKANFPISLMCRHLNVPRAGYYAWRSRPPSARDRADTELVGVIKAIHNRSRGTYGAPRVHAELALEFGIRCGRKRVARLMRNAAIAGVHRRRGTALTSRDQERRLRRTRSTGTSPQPARTGCGSPTSSATRRSRTVRW